jgi:hypothetical protein
MIVASMRNLRATNDEILIIQLQNSEQYFKIGFPSDTRHKHSVYTLCIPCVFIQIIADLGV